MKYKLRKIIVCFSLLTFIGCSASNVPAPTKEHEATSPPYSSSSPELERIKALQGKWVSKTSMFGTKDQEVFTEYSITAGGSAVLEKIFPGTPQEMVSVYYDDDSGKLAMTHYCIMKNRPHFILAKSEPNLIKLDVTKIEGLKSKDQPSMGAITIKFVDGNNFISSCEGSNDDKKDPMTMRFTRVKE